MKKMKLNDVQGDFYWLKHKKPGPDIITFLLQSVVWIVGGIIIICLAPKEFYERRVKQWKN